MPPNIVISSTAPFLTLHFPPLNALIPFKLNLNMAGNTRIRAMPLFKITFGALTKALKAPETPVAEKAALISC